MLHLQDIPAAADEFGLTAARSLLREGAFSGLRDNIRAIGEYAEGKLGKETAKNRVAAIFNSINDLDLLLFQVRALL